MYARWVSEARRLSTGGPVTKLLLVAIFTAALGTPAQGSTVLPGSAVLTTTSATCSGMRGFYTRSGNEVRVNRIKVNKVPCLTARSVLRNLTEGRDLGYQMGPYGKYGHPLAALGFRCRKQKYAVQTALVLCKKGNQQISAVAEAAHAGGF